MAAVEIKLVLLQGLLIVIASPPEADEAISRPRGLLRGFASRKDIKGELKDPGC
jgi:hypothetical protein